MTRWVEAAVPTLAKSGARFGIAEYRFGVIAVSTRYSLDPCSVHCGLFGLIDLSQAIPQVDKPDEPVHSGRERYGVADALGETDVLGATLGEALGSGPSATELIVTGSFGLPPPG